MARDYAAVIRALEAKRDRTDNREERDALSSKISELREKHITISEEPVRFRETVDEWMLANWYDRTWDAEDKPGDADNIYEEGYRYAPDN